MDLLISPTCTFTLFLFVADSNAMALKFYFVTHIMTYAAYGMHDSYIMTHIMVHESYNGVKNHLNVASSGAFISTL